MTPVFIDTGAFLARHLESDEHHEASLAVWRSLEQRKRRCFSSNFVLDEALTLLGRRAGHAFATERGRAWLSSSMLEVLRPQAEDELTALALFEKFADQAVGFTDCVSFALMHRYNIQTAFTFDRHFRTAGFVVLPDLK
jgi:predicted nucleic acid-binding protein